MEQRIKLRDIKEQDELLLFGFYVSTRTDVHAANFSDAEKEEFLRMQFKAQSTHYQSHFPDASFQIILLDEEPVGRFYVDRAPELIKVLDIIVSPEHRTQGIARFLMERVLAEAADSSRCVQLHVDADNPVVEAWYRRLGFVELERTAMHIHMEWSPQADVGT